MAESPADLLSEDSRRAVAAFADYSPPGTVPVEVLRARLPLVLAVVAKPGPSLRRVRDDAVPGGAGQVPVRVYVPERCGGDVLVYAHGGGWVAGSPDTHDALVRRLARAVGCVVVSVDYRLAPEHPFPAGLDDVLAVLERARALARAHGAAADGALAVGGDSAGGNLAAAAAIACRDRSLPLDLQALINPVLRDHRRTPPGTPSPADFPGVVEVLRWEWDQYLPLPGAEWPPLAVPEALADMRGLAPAAILAAEHDLLVHEARAYAERLGAAGVPVAFRIVPGAVHGFLEHTRMGGQAERELAWLAGAIAGLRSGSSRCA